MQTLRSEPKTVSYLLRLAIIVQLILGVLGPISKYQDEFWQDSLRHNSYAYSPNDFNEFRKEVSKDFQPIMEYSFRRYIVFPILGLSETTMRLPDLIWWIITLVLLPVLTNTLIKRFGVLDENWRLIFVLISCFWLVNTPTLIRYAVEGRHYSLCALISIIWIHSLFSKGSRNSNLFNIYSLLYVNTHFFVWPLVGLTYLKSIISTAKEKRIKESIIQTLWAIGIFTFSIILNYKSIERLVIKTPGKKETSSISLNEFFPEMFSLINQYIQTFELGFIIIPAIAVAILSKNRQFIFSYLCLLLVLTLIKFTSDYNVSERYFIPFTGIAWVTLITLCIAIPKVLVFNKETGGGRKVTYFASLTATIITMSLAGVKSMGYIDQISKMDLTRENFSKLHEVFSELERLDRPIAITSMARYEAETCEFYATKLRKTASPIYVVRGDLLPWELSETWEPISKKYPDLINLLYTTSEGREFFDSYPILYQTKHITERYLYELPKNTTRVDLVQILKRIRTIRGSSQKK
jgi:hypothetical protein